MRLTPYGKLLRQIRIEKETTLSAMSDAVGISPAFASAVETGVKKIPEGYPEKCARALGLTQAETQALREAAELSVKEVKVPLNRHASSADREVVALFARRFDRLSEEKKLVIRKALED